MNEFEHPYYIQHYAQVSGEMAETLAPEQAFLLRELRVHASEACSPTAKVQLVLDAEEGTSYDYNVVNESISGETDYGQTWGPSLVFANGDKLNLTVGVSGEGVTYGAAIVWKPI